MMRAVRLCAAASLVVTLVAGSAAPAAAAAAAPGPPLQTPVTQLAAAFKCPNGIHNPHRRPVLLVHGTSVTAEENWGWTYVPALAQAGYDVCTVEMPDYAFRDIQESVEYVVYGIRQEAALTHQRITTIGLSQGGIEPRWALKWWPDIHNLVASYIAMATPNHGASFGYSCAYNCIPSVWQQSIGSNLLSALNRGTEAPYLGDVAYTSVYSLTDDIIQPALPTPTAAVAGGSNIAVQDICPGRYVGHIQSAWDAAYYAVVMDALSHNGAADPARVDRSFCNQQGMPGVDPVTGWSMTAELYTLAGARQSVYPGRTTSEPPLRCYATAAGCGGKAAGAAGGAGVAGATAGAVTPNTGSQPLPPPGALGLGAAGAALLAASRRPGPASRTR